MSGYRRMAFLLLVSSQYAAVTVFLISRQPPRCYCFCFRAVASAFTTANNNNLPHRRTPQQRGGGGGSSSSGISRNAGTATRAFLSSSARSGGRIIAPGSTNHHSSKGASAPWCSLDHRHDHRLYSTDDGDGDENFAEQQRQPQLPRNGTGGVTATAVQRTTQRNGATQPSSSQQQFPPPVQGDQPVGVSDQQAHHALPLRPSDDGSNVDLASILAVNPSEVEIVTVESPAEREEEPTPDLIRQLPFVSMFRGSANYIANHRNTLAVYHIPGGLMDLPDPTVFRDLMNDVALTWLLGMKIVLVVGCRYQIEKRVRTDQEDMYHGLRVTDESTLRVVKEEAGYVRFEVERQLARSLRIQGSGSSTGGGVNPEGYYDGNVVSGNFYSAQPFGILDGVDYMYTGFVRKVEVEKIRKLHENRDICLLTTLGVSPSGEVFNVNSESLAASVSGALQASKIVYFTEQEMEIRHTPSGNKIQGLRLSDGRNLLKYCGIRIHKKGFVAMEPGVTEKYDRSALDMLLKVGFSVQALEQGVKRAHIISPKHGALLQELYTRDGSGTLVSGDLYEGIRRATVNDVAGIYDLISPLIKMGTLVDRPKAKLEKDAEQYYVYTRDELIVACGQLTIFEDGFAEIGCLVVNHNYRSSGRGDAMLGYLERMCLMNGCTTVFVLSTQTMEWFVERGFDSVEVDRLPPSRQKTYNHARNSKIYMKKIESVRDLDASELWWNR